MKANKNLYLNLVDNAFEGANGDVACWNGLASAEGVVSLAKLVEIEAENIRDEFVDWASKLAQVNISQNTNLVSFFKSDLLNGGSFWWTNLIAQHSPLVSPAINDVFKIRALEKCYMENGYCGLVYHGKNIVLAEILEAWMREIGQPFLWNNCKKLKTNYLYREFSKSLSHYIKAAVYFSYFFFARFCIAKLIGGAKKEYDNNTVIFSYFPNINIDKLTQGEFYSYYWGGLPKLLKDLKNKVTWVWIYTKSTQVSFFSSVRLRARLNKNTNCLGGEDFILLEDSITITSFLNSVYNYIKLCLKSYKIKNVRIHFRFCGSNLNFYELLRSDWQSSIIGVNSAKHFLYANALKYTLSNVVSNNTKRLLYPWENQGWEQILLLNSCRLNTTTSYGFVHTSSCTAPLFMRTFLGGGTEDFKLGRPHPTWLLATGDFAKSALTRFGWNEHQILCVEALRQVDLAGKKNIHYKTNLGNKRTLLVICGYTEAETKFQLELLSDAASMGALDLYTEIIVKPHPFCDISKLLTKLSLPCKFYSCDDKLELLFGRIDVVYAANSTSAAIEAAWYGLPVILTSAMEGLDMSPLRGLANKNFISNVDELTESLINPCEVLMEDNYFNFSYDLQGWRHVFN